MHRLLFLRLKNDQRFHFLILPQDPSQSWSQVTRFWSPGRDCCCGEGWGEAAQALLLLLHSLIPRSLRSRSHRLSSLGRACLLPCVCLPRQRRPLARNSGPLEGLREQRSEEEGRGGRREGEGRKGGGEREGEEGGGRNTDQVDCFVLPVKH